APQESFVHGPFRVLRTLGAGGCGVAVAAQDVPTNRLMCIKVFLKDNLKFMSLASSPLNELAVYKRLALARPCPGTRFLMGLELSFQTTREICFVMDLMTNDLSHLMKTSSSYCYRHARRWTVQLALGINALHELGIIHRDIKAGNILVDVRENVRIADFGLSYLAADARPLDRQWACSTDVVGTPYIMAPEMLLFNVYDPDAMAYGPPVDWWALGCVLYQLVSPNHMAIFKTQRDTLDYAAWCTSNGGRHRQFPILQNLKGNVGDLICGLLDPSPSWRYGFREVSSHQLFLNPCGTSEFFDAYACALKRPAVPESMPDLRCDLEKASILQRLAPGERRHLPDVDWFKPV
ncbi:kinase-like domain-containing protein, partial [Suillus occidentalis]